MSKLLNGKKYSLKLLKKKNNNNLYTNKSIQDIIDSYRNNSLGISTNFTSFDQNKANIDSPKYYSPNKKSQVSLPPISDKNRKPNKSQIKSVRKKILNSNSSTNLYSQSILDSESKKHLEREKTQVTLIENNLEKNKNSTNNINQSEKKDNEQNLNNITKINNITNINIHIYQRDINRTKDNINKDELNKKNDFLLNNINTFSNDINLNNDIMSNPQNSLPIINPNKINNGSSSLLSNVGMSIINQNLSENKNIYNKKDKKIKNLKKKIKINPSLIYANKRINNSISSLGEMKMNTSNNIKTSKGLSQDKNITNNKNIDNSLPDISRVRSDSSDKKLLNFGNDILELLKEDNDINEQDSENINISMNFLKDLSTNNTTFVSFLKLMQTHMDIELLLNNTYNFETNLMSKKTKNAINNEKIFKLNNLLNTYFNILSTIYIKNNISNNQDINNQENNNNQNKYIDEFFLYQSLDAIFHKCIKIQICLFASILVTLSRFSSYEINTLIKNHFHQIIKEISNPLLNIFETFIKEEINLNYPELITINLRKDFNDHYNKLIKIHKFRHNYQNSELISLISKNLDKSLNSMKYYTTLKLKYSLLKPFGDALNQLLFSIDRKTLNEFAIIMLNTLLFGDLDINKKRASNINNNKNISKNSMGSSIVNNIKEFPPFLPPINEKYKYTLVLDMDETLIYYFFIDIDGMLFVRPYCFEFLKELNEFYEIVIFTAGTKEYADNILNMIDIDNNIFKYRLYRQHATVNPGNDGYKDLSKIGRDLRKVIIIDNMKQNFRAQPNNGLCIKTWISDINDVQFKDLLKILKDIVIYNINDVRHIIKKINDEIKISRNIIRPFQKINILNYIR